MLTCPNSSELRRLELTGTSTYVSHQTGWCNCMHSGSQALYRIGLKALCIQTQKFTRAISKVFQHRNMNVGKFSSAIYFTRLGEKEVIANYVMSPSLRLTTCVSTHYDRQYLVIWKVYSKFQALVVTVTLEVNPMDATSDGPFVL